jgi:hypothetical protein
MKADEEREIYIITETSQGFRLPFGGYVRADVRQVRLRCSQG